MGQACRGTAAVLGGLPAPPLYSPVVDSRALPQQLRAARTQGDEPAGRKWLFGTPKGPEIGLSALGAQGGMDRAAMLETEPWAPGMCPYFPTLLLCPASRSKWRWNIGDLMASSSSH